MIAKKGTKANFVRTKSMNVMKMSVKKGSVLTCFLIIDVTVNPASKEDFAKLTLTIAQKFSV